MSAGDKRLPTKKGEHGLKLNCGRKCRSGVAATTPKKQSACVYTTIGEGKLP